MNEISEIEKKILKSFSEKIDPNDAGAHNNLAVVYFNKGLYSEAIELLNTALEIDPGFVLAQNNLDIVLKKSGRWHDYIDSLLKDITDDPLNISKRMKLADSYRKIGNHPQAVNEYLRIIEIDPDYASAYYGLGLIYKTIGKIDDAISNLNKAIELEPNNAKFLHLLGEVYFHQGNIDKSIEFYEKGLEIDPDSAEGHFMLGFALGEKGNYDDAMSELKKAVELNPELAQIQPNLPINIAEHKSFAQLLAKSSEEKAPTEKKDDSRLNLADSFLNRGLFDEAKKELQKIIEDSPDNFHALLRIAKIAVIKKEFDEANATLDKIREIEPQDVEALNLRGVVKIYEGQPEEAENILRVATETVKNFAPALNNLGLIRISLGDVEQAVKTLDLAASLDNLQASWNLGLYYINSNQFQKALDLLSGEHPKLRFGQALALIKTDKEETALKILEDVGKAIPNFAPVYYQLGYLLSKMGDFKNSISNMKRGFELDPTYEKESYQIALDNNFEYSLPLPEIQQVGVGLFAPEEIEEITPEPVEKPISIEELFEHAKDLYQSGKIAEAREKLEVITEKEPDFAPPKLMLIEILIGSGDLTKAKELIATLQNVDDDTQILALRARIARIEEDSAELERVYQRLYQLDNNNAEALGFLAQKALRDEKLAEAEDYIKHLQETSPNQYETHLLLGLLAVKRKDIDRATLEFEKVITIDSGQSLPYYHLGLLYAQKGRFEDAINNWKKCLLLNPESEIAEKTRRCLEVTLELEEFLKRESEIV